MLQAINAAVLSYTWIVNFYCDIIYLAQNDA